MSAYLEWVPVQGAFATSVGFLTQPKHLAFDCTVSITHQGTADITEHPVEKGADITDHAKKNVGRFSMEAFITNSPIYDNDFSGEGSVYGKSLPLPQTTNAFAPQRPPLITWDLWFNPLPFVGFSVTVGRAIPDMGLPAAQNAPSAVAQTLSWSADFETVRETRRILEELQTSVQIISVITPEKVYENMILESFIMAKDKDTGDGANVTLEFRELRIVETKLLAAPVPSIPRGSLPVSKGAKNAKPTEKQKESNWWALAHGQYPTLPSLSGDK